MKYQAFISYKHSDISRKRAIAVEKALKKYAKPWWKPTNIKIFRDEKEMQPGDNLGASINYALENSEFLLYFASKEAAQSEWVQKELLKWCGELQRTDKLIIIHVADNIVTDAKEEKIIWEQTDALPSFLEEYINYIPIYEDLSWASQDVILDLENPHFREIINSITARFRGKTPAEMNDENVLIDRRNKRIKNLAIGIFAALFISSIIAILIAVYHKNRADKQYRETVKQKIWGDEQYKETVRNRLSQESGLILPTDNVKAIRIAEAAYKISKSPSPAVVRVLSEAAYSTWERPFYTAEFKHEGVINTAVFSPDGSKILTASNDKTAKLWDLQGNLLADLKGHTSSVTSALFSPDGRKILTASWDDTAKLWDLQGNLLADLKGHIDTVVSAVFSPDGSKIITASNDNTAKLWDLTGKLLVDVKGHTDNVKSAVFSPDSSKILTFARNGIAKLWDLSGKHLAEFYGHTGFVISSVFSPDGSKILTASENNTAKLWDLTGKLLVEMKGHTESVNSAVFSPDGSKILTASKDNTAKLWDLTGNLLADLLGHTACVSSAVFSPDGKRIVTASNDGTAIIWLTPEGIMEWLKTAPIPKLTQQEKKELGIADFDID